MDKLLSEEKELRSEDDKQSSPERKKKVSVTAIEARLSAVQKLSVFSGRLEGSTTGGGGEPMTIT
jgi:hypothetical protein